MESVIKKRTYYFYFTGIFTVTFFVAYYYFFKNGKSFLRILDGLDQHYVFFVYIGKWLRQIFYDLFYNHTLSIPLWTFDLGYGSDILTSSGAYIGDPFNWLSALCPPRYAEYLFNFIIFLKMYLAGIAFSLFAFYHKQAWFPTLCGALLYSLCGVMFVAPIESFFINPMILFPLLMMAAHKSLNGQSPVMYTILLAVSFLNYFYFAYMIAVLVFLYCILWYLFQCSQKSIRHITMLFGKFFISSCIGLLISAVLVLPIAGVLGSAERLNIERAIPPLYTPDYYFTFFEGFFNFADIGPDSYTGFTPLAFLGCFILFSKRKTHFFLKTIFLFLTFMACIPWLGYAMNGFGYVANRWIWAYALCVSYIVTITVPNILNLRQEQLHKAILCFLLISCIFLTARHKTNEETLILVGLFLIYLLFLFIWRNEEKRRMIGTLCILSLSLGISARSFYSPDKEKFPEQIQLGSALDRHTADSPTSLIKQINDDTEWRFDSFDVPIIRNNGMMQNLKSFNFYISIYNNNVDQFHQEIALPNMLFNMEYQNLDSNPVLTKLLGTKYFMVKSDDLTSLPYGYDEKIDDGTVDGRQYSIYTSQDALPLAYTYQSAISRDLYERLTPLEKQEVLMDYCVLDRGEEISLFDLRLNSEEVPYSVTSPNGITVSDNRFTVNDNTVSLSLNPASLEKGYNYFLLFNYLYYDGAEGNAYGIDVSNGTRKKHIEGLTPDSHMYGGKHTGMLNLGNGDFEKNRFDLKFTKAGSYSFDSIKLLRLPLTAIDTKLKNRSASAVKDLTIKTNTITCSKRSSQQELLFISCPYSKGWKATVNGKPAVVEKANTAFMAVALEPGENDVVLNYTTPLLSQGLFLSLLGLTGLFVMFEKQKTAD